jgi:IS1 family transposase
MLSIMNRLDTKRRAAVVAALVEGNSLRATARMTGVARMTVEKLLRDLGQACAVYQDKHLRNLTSRRIQCDEIWSFIYAKKKNVTAKIAEKHTDAGDVWTWTAIDADTKLVLSYRVGSRDAGVAYDFMQDIASRLRHRVQLTTDGHRPYVAAVEDTFGADIDYATLTKIYGSASDGETRYSPAVCLGCESKTVTGNPDPKHISTSYVGRQKLTMRMSMRRFTRLTNAFSKKAEMHAHSIALHFMYYNFARIHQTLRVTPAMEAGVSDHAWSLGELVALLGDSVCV